MAKFAGSIGYIIPTETEPGSGIFLEDTTEKHYHGDLTRRRVRYVSGSGINDNIQLSSTISIVANGFAKEHIGYMRYAVLGGVKWAITDASFSGPRIVLTLGGVYNGTSA